MKNIRYQLKEKLRKREKIFGGWISFDHPGIAELFGMAGFDFIGIDMEHAPISLNSAQSLMARIQSNNTVCLPRPVSHSDDIFKPLLDSGADGLLVQMVNSKYDLEKIVNSLKFPPLGKRTFGVNRAHGYGLNFDSYVQNWNEESILIAQIESKEGVSNIHEIISNKFVDGVMIGPYDLSGSYGVPGDTSHPKVQQAAKSVIKACKEKGKSCGTQISSVDNESIMKAFDEGFNFIILSSDLFLIQNWVKEMRKLMINYS